MYILLFNSCIKFHLKICTHCWNVNKSWRDCFLFTRPVYADDIISVWLMSIGRCQQVKANGIMQPVIWWPNGGPQVPHYFWIKHVQQHQLGKLLYVKKYCVVRTSHNTIFFDVGLQHNIFSRTTIFPIHVVGHVWFKSSVALTCGPPYC